MFILDFKYLFDLKLKNSNSRQLKFLQISERTDSHDDNLHVCLTLWDRVLQLGAEVESWSSRKIAVFAQSPSFQTEDDINTLQVKLCFFYHTVIYSLGPFGKLNAS